MDKNAPICIFTYKKVEPLQRAIEALQKNHKAPESELYFFSDGPKNEDDTAQIEQVRAYISQIDGFKSVEVVAQKENKGLARSIIEGVSEVLKKHGSIIVLEDDLVTSRNFLDFMNQALHAYRSDEKIFSISGYTTPIEKPPNHTFDNYFTRRGSSWGWATWKDRWEKVDWSVSDYNTFSTDRWAKRKFNKMGSDMSAMLAKQMTGKISSWAIRWCYHQFKHDLYTVYPTMSKITNIGFGENATHTKGSAERYATPLDTSGKKDFRFDPNPKLDQRFIKQFVTRFSIRS
ncbi:MAG: glycosyltransferase [Pricia sp.]